MTISDRQRHGGAPATVLPRRHMLAFVLLALAPVAVFINLTGVTALEEALGADLHVSGSNLGLIVNIAAIATAPLVLVAGNLGARFGRKRIYVIGSIAFAVASFVCAIAQSFAVLVVFRALQGIGAGVLTALSLSLIARMLGPGRQGLAIGAWGSGNGLGLVGGPLLGASLIHGGHWRWLFVIVGALALLVSLGTLALADEPRTHVESDRPFDYAGAVASTAAVALIAVGVTYGASWGWSNGRTVAVLAAGVVLFIVFAAVESRAQAPLVHVRVFRVPSYAAAATAAVIVLIVVLGTFVFAGLSLQVNLHETPLHEGLLYLPLSVFQLFFSAPLGRLIDRIGPRPVFAGTAAVAAAGMFYLAATALRSDPSYVVILPGLVLVGLAAAGGPPTSGATLIASRPPERVSEGAAINGTLVQIGSAIGTGLVSGVFSTGYPGHIVSQIRGLGLGPAQTQHALAAVAQMRPPTGLSPSDAARVAAAVHLAFGHTLQDMLIALGALGLVAVALALRIRRGELSANAASAPEPPTVAPGAVHPQVGA